MSCQHRTVARWLRHRRPGDPIAVRSVTISGNSWPLVSPTSGDHCSTRWQSHPMEKTVIERSGNRQFTLSSVFVCVTFAGLLFAMISQRSPWGVCAWSLAGMGYSSFVRYQYLRRSLLMFFLGTFVLSLCWLHIIAASPQRDPWSVLVGLAGCFLVFCGGIATVDNLVVRHPEVARQQ